MHSYKHFLITRFNLKVEAWKRTKNAEEVRTEEWLRNRFELFETYCLPSVINQSNQNFIWYVFFDIDTPEIYRKKVNDIAAKYQNFKCLYIDGLKELTKSVEYEIKKNIDVKKEEFIITTRLDNDDVIHKDFIDTIQSTFQPIDNTVIDIREGYQLSIENDKSEIREYTHPFNAFISVIEKSSNFKTILSKMHYDWSQSKSVIIFDKKRLWIELVHQKNKMNSTLKNIKKIYMFDYEVFSLNIDCIKLENKWIILCSNITLKIKLFIIAQLKKSRYIKSIAKKIKFFLNGYTKSHKFKEKI